MANQRKSRGRRKTKLAAVPQQPTGSNVKIIALALIAGAVGAGGIWALLPKPGPTPQPESPRAVVADAPPSVANLSPAHGALLLGNWHYDRQRWDEAVAQYETALRLGLDNPDVRTDLGNCFRFLGQPEKAQAEYEKSQRQNPQHQNSLFNLAALHSQVLNDKDKARELLNEYLRRFPGSDGAMRAQAMLAELGERTLPPNTERILRELISTPSTPAR